MSYRDRRLPIGTRVSWTEDGCTYQGVVVRHGRDAGGVYTEVRPAGQIWTLRLHRSMLRPQTATGDQAPTIYQVTVREHLAVPRVSAQYLILAHSPDQAAGIVRQSWPESDVAVDAERYSAVEYGAAIRVR